MSNRLISSTPIRAIQHGNQTLQVKYATETESWKRILLSTATQDRFAEAVKKAEVPAGATTAVMTYIYIDLETQWKGTKN